MTERMLTVALSWVIAIGQLAVAALVLVAGAHLLRLAGWAAQHPLARGPLKPAQFPTVTVQLPMRNERYVAERVLRAACALAWPQGRLEVQALDDSDDDTRELIDRVAAELRAGGHDVKVLRRETGEGHKAGNLAHGLLTARGELVAVLDADSVPPPDLLERLAAALLVDEKIGFAQARWSFDNERAGVLTRVQALILDGLQAVEQARLSATSGPLQFNGTAGLWRRAALDEAGGWLGAHGASMTEDLDLAYRARLRGYRGVQVEDCAVSSELPTGMAAFRAQQERWVRGAAEVLRALPSTNLSMLAHLARHARQPLLVALSIWLPATATGLVRPAFAVPGAAILSFALVAVSAYYAAARARLGRSPTEALGLGLLVPALSLGLSLTLTVAFVRGLVGGRGEWVRTPKSAGAAAGYRSRRPPLALVESALGVALAASAALALARGDGWTAAGVAYVAAGWLWVGFGSLA
jgi:cellulose synthase/poly-beta-1,6-N-acetylglucosamine synthase-like glycosyltransferase